jgi:hypothetical protein
MPRIYVDRTALTRNREDGRGRFVYVVVGEDGEEVGAHGVKITGVCELVYIPLGSPIPGIEAFLDCPEQSCKVEIIK